MSKRSELPLRLAKEICQKLVERRLLGLQKLPGALSYLGENIRNMLVDERGVPILTKSGDLTLRLIEQGSNRTPEQALDTLKELTEALKSIALNIPPERAIPALRTAVDLTIKLLEVHFISNSQVIETVNKLALTAATIMPELPAPRVHK
ncbi:MAG: hypothetical protein LBE31_01940 [Deltaproteobacteria bacterium]|nr:hypothetical protein [Deltaproteobacteria bacterium]